MLHFQIPNDTNNYIIPTSLKDITLRDFVGYCDLEKNELPTDIRALHELQDELSLIPESDKLDRQPVLNKIEVLQGIVSNEDYEPILIDWYAKVVSYWTKLSYNKIIGYEGEGMQLSQLKALYYQFQELVTPSYEPEYSQVIEHNDKLWYLPEQNMTNGTVIEYLEASNFQKLANELAGGEWHVFAKIMCILVKKKDEKYSKDLMIRESMFLDWTMDKVWAVAFFLLKRTETLKTAFLTYTKALNLARLKQELNG